MNTMKAVVYYGPGEIGVEEISIPGCGRDELLVKVDACAICGTDLKSYRHGNPRIKAPLVMGHEFSGLVEKAGQDVDGFFEGDRIVMATSISCGTCYYCKRGWNNLCTHQAPMGFSFPGGMAEYVVIPSQGLEMGHVLKVPSGLEAEYAALAEPISCVVNCMENCRIQKGDSIVILGAGPMGLMNVSVAQSYGAGKIILSEISEKRIKHAEQFKCNLLVNPNFQDLINIVMEATDGMGADVAIVAAPAPQPQELAIKLVRKRGTVCLFASLPQGQANLTLNSRSIHYGELRLVGTSDSTPRHVEKAIELLSNGKIPYDKLVTHILKLDDILKAFDLMESGEALRVVLKP